MYIYADACKRSKRKEERKVKLAVFWLCLPFIICCLGDKKKKMHKQTLYLKDHHRTKGTSQNNPGFAVYMQISKQNFLKRNKKSLCE